MEHLKPYKTTKNSTFHLIIFFKSPPPSPLNGLPQKSWFIFQDFKIIQYFKCIKCFPEKKTKMILRLTLKLCSSQLQICFTQMSQSLWKNVFARSRSNVFFIYTILNLKYFLIVLKLQVLIKAIKITIKSSEYQQQISSKDELGTKVSEKQKKSSLLFSEIVVFQYFVAMYRHLLLTQLNGAVSFQLSPVYQRRTLVKQLKNRKIESKSVKIY